MDSGSEAGGSGTGKETNGVGRVSTRGGVTVTENLVLNSPPIRMVAFGRTEMT